MVIVEFVVCCCYCCEFVAEFVVKFELLLRLLFKVGFSPSDFSSTWELKNNVNGPSE